MSFRVDNPLLIPKDQSISLLNIVWSILLLGIMGWKDGWRMVTTIFKWTLSLWMALRSNNRFTKAVSLIVVLLEVELLAGKWEIIASYIWIMLEIMLIITKISWKIILGSEDIQSLFLLENRNQHTAWVRSLLIRKIISQPLMLIQPISLFLNPLLINKLLIRVKD